MDRFEIEGEEVLDGTAKPSGNDILPGVNGGILSLSQDSAHVIVPKRWRGADVKVVRVSEPNSDE